MKLNLKAYAVLVGVFLLSVGSLSLVPESHEFLATIIAAPGVISLLAALFQLMRDQADYEKRLKKQRREFQFTLGSASHMADIAFDKHVEFCEKYMKELHEAVRTLYRECDSPAALQHAPKLYDLRQNYATCLTNKINQELDEFETALRRLGADAHFVSSTAGNAKLAEQHLLRLDRNFELFGRILGLRTGDNVPEQSMVDILKSKVRSILGVEELTRLRDHLIKQASSAVASSQ